MKKKLFLPLLAIFAANFSFAQSKTPGDTSVNVVLNRILSGLLVENLDIAKLQAMNIPEIDDQVFALRDSQDLDDAQRKSINYVAINVREMKYYLPEAATNAYYKKKVMKIAAELKRNAKDAKLNMVNARTLPADFKALYSKAAAELRNEHKDSLAIYNKQFIVSHEVFYKFIKEEHAKQNFDAAYKKNYNKLEAAEIEKEIGYKREKQIQLITAPDMSNGELTLLLSKWNEGRYSILDYVTFKITPGTSEKKMLKLLKTSLYNHAAKMAVAPLESAFADDYEGTPVIEAPDFINGSNVIEGN